jgi:hypothetical protein
LGQSLYYFASTVAGLEINGNKAVPVKLILYIQGSQPTTLILIDGMPNGYWY